MPTYLTTPSGYGADRLTTVTDAIPVDPLGIPTVARQLAATATSASTALTATTSRISIRARFADIRFVVGVGTQTANASTSHFIANGERLDIDVPLGASIGVIRESAASVNGSLAVSELN
jgi:hypothetical protein